VRESANTRTRRVAEGTLAASLDTIASAKRILRQINLLPGMLYLPLKCKSAAIRLAHSVAASNEMFSRIKTFASRTWQFAKNKWDDSSRKLKEANMEKKSRLIKMFSCKVLKSCRMYLDVLMFSDVTIPQSLEYIF